MKIKKDTIVADILSEYGDIEQVMEVFGIESVGRYSLRKVITKFLTVERAAKIHRVPPEEFLRTLTQAIELKQKRAENE